jgi:hypothetical protein
MLKRYSQTGVFTIPDKPIEVRRKSTFGRLKYRAHREGNRMVVADGVSFIDDVAVFSLQSGCYTMVVMANLIPLTVISYNCRGFNTLKPSYIKMLPSKATLVFLQEHWLSEGQLSKLGDIDTNNNFLFTVVSGFDNSEVLSGRPYGGCQSSGDRTCMLMWKSLRLPVEGYVLLA